MSNQLDESQPQLPRIWAGERRRHMSLLVLSGLGQAVAAGMGARLLANALRPSGGHGHVGALFSILVVTALAVGALRMVEKVLSERLSQHYVHEIRLALIRGNLADGEVKSLGVAVTRTSNDLTSVKNWVSQGVAPLAVGVPLILGVGIALAWLQPLFAVALVAPIGVLLAAMSALAPVAYQRSRTVRRHRGRLSSQVADTILSMTAIRSGGGQVRELRRISVLSEGLVRASIERAKIAGALRGAAAAAAGVASAAVVGIGLAAGMGTHTIAGALAIVGFLATPVHDLGRVAEYRQSYRAARRIIGPLIKPSSELQGTPAAPSHSPAVGGAVAGVLVSGMTLDDRHRLPDLVARPGERIVLTVDEERLASQALARLVGLPDAIRGSVVIDGCDLSTLAPTERRRLVGYAARDMLLVRGSVLRNLRYRCPDATMDEVDRLLSAVGLTDRISALPRGTGTMLVHGGEPLSTPERARLLVARAILHEPPLLVLDHVDADLGNNGCSMLRDLLTSYPGVVILASDDPTRLVQATQIWRPAARCGETAPRPSVDRRRAAAMVNRGPVHAE